MPPCGLRRASAMVRASVLKKRPAICHLLLRPTEWVVTGLEVWGYTSPSMGAQKWIAGYVFKYCFVNTADAAPKSPTKDWALAS